MATQATYGAVVDAILNIGMAWRVKSYTSSLSQQLIDALNTSGFRVQQFNDDNLALLTGGSIKVRVQITSYGYSSAQDAASVVQGVAASLGYNVTGFSGALVSPGTGGNPSITDRSNVTYPAGSDPNNRAATTGLLGLLGLTASHAEIAVGLVALLVVIKLFRD